MGCASSKSAASDGEAPALAKPEAPAAASSAIKNVRADEKAMSKLMGPGEYFGELAMLTSKPRAVTVRSVGPCKCLWVDRATFDRILGPLKDRMMEEAGKYEEYLSQLSPEEKDSTDAAAEDDAGNEEDDEEDVGELVMMAPPKKGNKHSKRKSVFVQSANLSEDWTAPSYEKDDATMARIKSLFAENPLMQNVEEKDVNVLALALKNENRPEGDTIIRQGDMGDVFYLLDSGSADCFVGEEKVKEYGPGETFGELALLHGDRRAATIKATSDVSLWTLDGETFRRVLQTSAFKQQQQQEKFVKSISIFQSLSPYEMFRVAEVLQPIHFEDDKNIISQGDAGDNFYVIQEGSVVCVKKA